MTIAEQMRQEGEAKGRAEGEARARVDILGKLLTLKFGSLDTSTVARLHAASPELLDRWVERVLTAERVEDVFAD